MENFRTNRAYKLSLYLLIVIPLFLFITSFILNFLRPYVFDIDYVPYPSAPLSIFFALLEQFQMPICVIIFIVSLLMRFVSSDDLKKWWDIIVAIGVIPSILISEKILPSILKLFNQEFLYYLVFSNTGKGVVPGAPIPPPGGWRYNPADLQMAETIRISLSFQVAFLIAIVLVALAGLIAVKYLLDYKRRIKLEMENPGSSAY